MATYEAHVPSSWGRDKTFDYLADFTNVSQWDPSMQSAVLISGEPGQKGARYRLVMDVLGRDTELTYEAIDVDRPRRFVMRCENDTMISTDTITVADDATVSYEAHIDLHGARKLADPLVQVGLTRASDQARDSLTGILARKVV